MISCTSSVVKLSVTKDQLVYLWQAKDSYGHIHRHVSKLLRKADIILVTPSRHRAHITKKQEGGSPGGGNRKPLHALLPEEEQDEIPVHGPDGK